MSIRVEDYLSLSYPEKYKGISQRFVMTSSFGTEVSVLSYGALIDTLIIPDKDGNNDDVMLGMKGLDEYLANMANHGSIVGRSANRISGASFVIDGERYNIPVNDGPNNLHGGDPSFQHSFWNGEVISKKEADELIKASNIAGISESDDEAILLSLRSPDGSAGFPGNLDAKVMYAWLKDETLLILYVGQTDKATIFAPTNHSYFNIAGHNSGNVKDQLLMIDSEKVNLKDSNNCTDGRVLDVAGTAFDCRTDAPMAQLIYSDDPQITISSGVDINYLLKTKLDTFSFVSKLSDPKTGRTMEVLTNFPGIQVYAGNHLGGNDQKGDIPYEKYGAVCLEAQLVPNAINLEGFGSPVIRPGETKYYACGYRFNK